MSGSISYPLRKAVMDGLAAHFGGLSGFNASADEGEVDVTYAYEFGANAAQRIYSGRAYADTPPAALKSGRNFRNERGTFEINVMVTILGGTADEADERVDAIGEVLEEWIADRKSNELAVTGLQSLIVTGWRQDYAGVDAGTASLRTYTVEYTARLT